MNPERPNTQLNLNDPAPLPGSTSSISIFSYLKPIRMNITLLIGVAFLLLAAWLALREHRWLSKAQFTSGEVVQMIPVRGTKGGYSYKPRVQYKTVDGQTHEFVRGYSSSPPDFTVGEKVSVAHDPQSGEARIVTFGQRFGLAWFVGSFGLMLTTLSVGFAIGRQLVPRIYLP